jgi:pantoate--beta-alanine ligase
MEVIRIPRVMQDTVRGELMRGRAIGLVPTMGALHEGHMHLVRMSRMENHLTAVSIFVNPTQFGPGEDLERYPRNVDEDIRKLREADVDFLLLPEEKAMYPEGFDTAVRAGSLGEKLCGRFRPGHFDGVATVVAKLLHLALPTRAYFGLKDYQQYLVIKKMVRDLNFPVEVVASPTVREEDGLAVSSRNRYLSAEARRAAPLIYRTLSEAARKLKEGAGPAEARKFMEDAFSGEPRVSSVEYAGVYHPKTLEDLEEFRGKALLAAAVRLGEARLIDNVLL